MEREEGLEESVQNKDTVGRAGMDLENEENINR